MRPILPVSEPEIPLEGGRLTKGVVRVGDTVRRPARESSPFVARLLAHFEVLGVPWAPRYLGRDAHGRDTLSYLPGSVPTRWRDFSDEQVRGAGALLRAFHDATRGSILAGEFPVVCHHDLGPNNTVFDGETPTALIDFDLAAPGQPLEDLGYSAWAWCISSKPERQLLAAQARQVRVLVDGYGGLGGAHPEDMVDAILEQQRENALFWTEISRSSSDVLSSAEKIQELIAWSERERAYTSRNRQAFEAALA